MAYNYKGHRVWPSIYKYQRMYPGEYINYETTDFRTDKRTCKWCGNSLKSKRQTSFCSSDCSTSYNRLSVWERGHSAFPYKILCRDKFVCQDCGKFVGYVNEYGFKIPIGIGVDVHHIIPVHIGGTDRQSNLTTLCCDCHNRRHGKTVI